MRNLRCIDLCKSFDGVQALAGVTLNVPPEGVVAIIGPNGAGKTTLLNVLTGFLRADSGKCWVGEMETTRLAAHRIARLGVARTFQDLRLITQVSLLENVMLACPNQCGERFIPALIRVGFVQEEERNRKEAMGLLRLVNLEAKAHDLAGEISYGQQKLLTIACCLATRATVLLLDEPVAGVHPEMRDRIVSLLGELRNNGRQIVFIEHDLSAVRQAADYVIVMDDGRVIAQGPTDEVLSLPEILEAYFA